MKLNEIGQNSQISKKRPLKLDDRVCIVICRRKFGTKKIESANGLLPHDIKLVNQMSTIPLPLHFPHCLRKLMKVKSVHKLYIFNKNHNNQTCYENQNQMSVDKIIFKI